LLLFSDVICQLYSSEVGEAVADPQDNVALKKSVKCCIKSVSKNLKYQISNVLAKTNLEKMGDKILSSSLLYDSKVCWLMISFVLFNDQSGTKDWIQLDLINEAIDTTQLAKE
jgi:hypothetical protein